MRKLFLTSMAVVAVACAAEVQARTISGTILEAGTNEPLVGATVMPIGGRSEEHTSELQSQR